MTLPTPNYPTKQKVYKHGLPFSAKLAPTLKAIYDRVYKNNKAAVIVIDGQMGSGKTYAAVQFADFFNTLHGLDLVDLTKKDSIQIAMGGSDFVHKLVTCYKKKLPVCIYDESGDYTGRGAMSRFNRQLNRIFETMRAFKVIVIMCLPSMRVLDRSLMDQGVVRFTMHIDRSNNHHATYKVYDLDRSMWLLKYAKEMTNPLMAYSRVYPNQYGQILPLETKRGQQLEKLSTAAKEAQATHAGAKMAGLFTLKEIAPKVNRSIPWLRKAIKECKITHKRIIKKAKYYHEDVIEQLLNYIDTKK